MAKVRVRIKTRGRTRAKMVAKAETQERENQSHLQPPTPGEKCANSGCVVAIVAMETNAPTVTLHLAMDSKLDPANLEMHADLRISKTPKISQQVAASRFRKNRSPRSPKIGPQNHPSCVIQEGWLPVSGPRIMRNIGKSAPTPRLQEIFGLATRFPQEPWQ